MENQSYIFPASFTQQRLWFLDQLDPGQSVYNMVCAVRIQTGLDAEALERCLNELVRRHESLRTTFAMVDGQPVQVIARELEVPLPRVDLSELSQDVRDEKARKLIEAEAEKAFDLAAGPLLRATLLQLSEKEHVLALVMHHIISDGWSLGIFLRELSVLYEAFSACKQSPLPELPIQYADYTVWQREWLQDDVLASQLAYWTEHLSNVPAALELGSDHLRPARQTFKGARRYERLPVSLADRLRELSRREGVTLFMTLLAAFDVLLSRYSGVDDVVVGTPIASRNRPELEGLIGFFANTLPLRVDLSGNPSFRELLARVREVALGAYSHQDVPFDRLVEELQPERSLSHTPLFQVIFAFENASPAAEAEDLKMRWLEIDRPTSRSDLSLFVTDKGAELSCMWEYSSDLFEGGTVAEMISSFENLLENILQDPAAEVGYLDIWNDAQRRRWLTIWNEDKREPGGDASFSTSGTPAPRIECMHERFAAQVELTPEAIAVVFGDRRLTYRELNARANQIAHYLQRRGVGPETPVGVYLERSEDLIIALLAVLKSGGAYMPLEPSYPAERLAFMLEDSRVPVLLTQNKLLPSLPDSHAEITCLDDWNQFAGESTSNPATGVTPDNLAYIIYTSGSTGKPKGVEVTHRSVVHLFDATRERLWFRAGDVWTVVHSSAFDFSVWEIWGCLLQGGSLVVVPLEMVQSPAEFFDLLCRERVTILNQTPAALRELIAARNRALTANRDWSVKLIVCGGDALDQDLAFGLSRLDVPVWNFYGPTESSVWTTCARIEQQEGAETERRPASIGPPLPDLQVYLLDGFLQPVPAGVPGELFIGGAGLARGYLCRPELTAERFIPNPFADVSGTRLYRTGDLARYRRDGRIEFIGRIDNQVKLRGFRVELGEIESVLTEHPEIAQAVVVMSEEYSGNGRLVAYIVAREGSAPGVNELRQHLRLSLPEYMVPSIFVTLAEMPLTPNKKVDRRALPAPDRSGLPANEYISPRTPIEELIADIWKQVLRVSRIGVYDNFFELGGHSLLATQVTARLRQTLHIDLPVRALFESLTLSALAIQLEEMVQGEGAVPAPPILSVAKEGKLPLSFAQQRLWFLDQLEPGNPFYNIGRALRLQGQLDVSALTATINHILRRHESLHTSFGSDEGTPYQRFVSEAPLLTLETLDLRELPEAGKEAEVQRLATLEIKQPFDLTQGPFLRAKLFRVDDEDHVLVLTMHHIVADEWSLAIMFRELSKLYNAFIGDEPAPLSDLPIQYVDYAAWQRQWLQGETLEKLVSFWRGYLAGASSVLTLPTDQPRPAQQSFRGAYETMTMSRNVTDELKQLSRTEGVTLFMSCLAAYQILLARFTGQQDFLIGTDVANRTRVETEGLIGFFTNLLPLRAQVARDLDFVTLLRQVRETTLEAYAHQDLPFEKLVEELRPERDLSRNPLVQVLLVMQNPATPIDLQGLEVTPVDLPLETSRFDLVLFLSEEDEGLSGFWLYNPDLFTAETIRNLSRNYQNLLEQIVKAPAARLDSFAVLIEEPKQKKMDQKDLKEARGNRLKSIRRKSFDLSQVSSIKTSFLDPTRGMPLLIEPAHEDVDLFEWAAGNQQFIEESLLRHGALLWRGFAVDSVSEFERFAGVLCPALFGEYGDLPREQQGGKVYGSTPYPCDEKILFHNESSHMHQWPMLIWFYCVTPAAQGGESPIVDCRRIYEALEPRIRENFERQGLMYVRNFTAGLDVSWQDFFHTTDRSVVESYCRKAGIDFEWKGDNGLRTSRRAPAVLKHPQTGELVFFNQLQLHHISCLNAGVRDSLLAMMSEEDLPRNVYYGDGSRIDDSVIQHIGELYEQLSVGFPWARHDVLMLNNMLVAHSRNPYVGERKIVVALGNLVAKEGL